jgi:DNA-binding protein HU-beta
MNKTELIDQIATSADISKAAAGRALDATVETIKEALKAGDSVSLIGFGTFYVGERAARTGRNPRTGKTLKSRPAKSTEVPLGQRSEGCTQLKSAGCLAQLVERRPYKANVGGSSPSAPTKYS